MVEDAVQFEANVDDMDPRLWPHVIDQLLQAGAHDAWVTPIVMKKGRPAHTLGVLCAEQDGAAVRSVIFRETTTIGVRELAARKHVLRRDQDTIEVRGEAIGIKMAYDDDGIVVNRSVEWDDVAAAADELGLSAKDVLAAATAAIERGD